MPHEIDIALVNKFFANECNCEEAELVATYLQNHLDELDTIPLFAEQEGGLIKNVSEACKRKIYAKIVGEEYRYRVYMPGIRRWLSVAAILVLLVGAYFLFTHTSQQPLSKEEVQVGVRKIFENNGKKTLKIKLPDSSEVVLNPMTTIAVNEKTFSIERIVEVDKGDAYFNVVKNMERPFSVIANGIKTTALGTEFWVENKLDSHQVSVKLVRGKVAVTSEDNRFRMDSVHLSPGQECRIFKATGNVKVLTAKIGNKKKVDKNDVLSDVQDDNNSILWTNDNLQFSKTKLKNLFRKLESRYNVTIVIDEKTMIEKANITGKILYADSLDIIMESICDINGLRYEKKNDTIYLRSR